jgi:hypothetical protein
MTNPLIAYLTEVVMSTLNEKRGGPGKGGEAGAGSTLKLSSSSSWW